MILGGVVFSAPYAEILDTKWTTATSANGASLVVRCNGLKFWNDSRKAAQPWWYSEKPNGLQSRNVFSHAVWANSERQSISQGIDGVRSMFDWKHLALVLQCTAVRGLLGPFTRKDDSWRPRAGVSC